MTEHATATVGLPPAFDVVPVDAARALMDQVRTAISDLERELEEASQQADDAETRAIQPELGDVVTSVRDDLRRMAEWLLSEAEAHAVHVRDDARTRAAHLVDGARRSARTSSDDDAPSAPLLRLAPPAD